MSGLGECVMMCWLEVGNEKVVVIWESLDVVFFELL